ncbi:UxaA family hydrolase [Mucilaginibacter myungsuensis]|uniref:Altronate dehydratase n=1 Tax=Mucilaginibacter myungsuensis TaxID=649104 RepID=A0A929KX73_9SPHI|nr:altronate dehydratase family protein [Mucilaginibacter myungsuensis]MBE9662113.1 altronate dehydratase [Mucilaginibacter myungsuensis]MDN3599453.1 altronate dehydratase family protein [Mucilaginibacter myungsuensis]
METGTLLEKGNFLKINAKDNVLVALKDLADGAEIVFHDYRFPLKTLVKAKHKFGLTDLQPGDVITMYGVKVGLATTFIEKGTALTTENIEHASSEYSLGHDRNAEWSAPDVSKWAGRTFEGFHRADGTVGTGNFWVVIPMVFCENRNTEFLKQAFLDQLGYKQPDVYEAGVAQLAELYKAGGSVDDILNADIPEDKSALTQNRLFPNIDGIKFLTHSMGCGGTKSDADALCGLLAGYITHPNVAGATVLSLGCQHAQVSMLKNEIAKRDANFSKPLIVLEQQSEGTEKTLMQKAIKQTFAALMEVNKQERRPAPLSKLIIGLECGGSDGFSGISANPAIGLVSDIVVALGGATILAEFPELCGVEQELADRCVDDFAAKRFSDLMYTYNKRAEESGSGFYANPSPGNIKDGLITDAIKSAGAAKKAGSSPVVAVLDHPEKVQKPGLHLLCTPGSDVESTSSEVGAGANVVLFTTGLGTPTGNPVAPVVKLSTNTALQQRMPDIIDIDCGTIIDGRETLQEVADRVMEYIISVASGETMVKADQLGQDDFIPWKRGVSL